MNREQLEEQAALHALGLLEGEELRAFESEMTRNPEAQTLFASFAAGTAGLALTAEQAEPPTSLRARVLAALPDRTQQFGISKSSPSASELAVITPVSFNWIPWALAASVALVAGLLLQSNFSMRDEVARLEAERTGIREELASTLQKNSSMETELAALSRNRQLDRIQIATLKSQLGDVPDASAVCAWDPESQQGILKVVNLPPPPAGKDYQLWIVDPHFPTPVNGGVFDTAANGEIRFPFHPDLAVTEINLFAVSLEQEGGVAVSAGRSMVLVGK